SPVTRIQKLRFLCFEISVPASFGYHPNQFHPKPIHKGPLALNSRPVVSLWPILGLASMLVVHPVFSWQEAQPLASLPTPSPFHTTTGLAAKGAGRAFDTLAVEAPCAFGKAQLH